MNLCKVKKGRPDRTAFFHFADRYQYAWLFARALLIGRGLGRRRSSPHRRYVSAEALLRDVDHYLKQEPLDARPVTTCYRLRKFVLRNRRAVLAASSFFLLIAGLVTFFTVRLAIARNAAVAEAARAERVQKFLFNLFQGGDEAAGPADDLRVVSPLDRGVQEAQSLDGDPAVQAELYETRGSIYQKLGKLDRAESLLQSSLKIRKSVFGEQA